MIISKKARIINFIIEKDDKKIVYPEIILIENDIKYFIELYGLDYAVYENEKGEIVTVKEKENEIFENIQINKIFNDPYIDNITKEDFNDYHKNKITNFVNNLYLNEHILSLKSSKWS